MTEVLFLIGRPVPHLLVFGAWLIWMWVSYYQQGKHLWMWELTNWGAIGYGCFLVIGFFAAIFYIDKDIESFKSIVFIIDHAFYWAWGGAGYRGPLQLLVNSNRQERLKINIFTKNKAVGLPP